MIVRRPIGNVVRTAYRDRYDLRPRCNETLVDASNWATTRDAVRTSVFGSTTLPTANVVSNVLNGMVHTGSATGSNRTITFRTGPATYGLDTVCYLFIPSANANGKAFVLIGGEFGNSDLWSAYGQGAAATALLQRGYAVLHVPMPFCGPNAPSKLVTWKDGVTTATVGGSTGPDANHNTLTGYDDPAKSDVKSQALFWGPPIQAVDWLTGNGYSGKTYTTGVSSGGWTAIVTGALDPRVQAAYGCAGMVPAGIWAWFERTSNSIDIEQTPTNPHIVLGGGVMGFNVMCALNTARKRGRHILAFDDDAGFGAVESFGNFNRFEACSMWRDSVRRRVGTGGDWDVLVDPIVAPNSHRITTDWLIPRMDAECLADA